jgi:hypothetical protein
MGKGPAGSGQRPLSRRGLIRLPRPGPSAQIGGPIGDRARRDRIAGPASFTPCRQRAARAGMADDQLIGALFAKLPAAGSPWPAREREAWLTLLELSLAVVYGPAEDQTRIRSMEPAPSTATSHIARASVRW